jgi:DNA polymerase-3 subunit epsilon
MVDIKTPLFPLGRIADIQSDPSRFRLLEQIPFTLADATFPVTLAPPIGDEVDLLILDLETTGLTAEVDKIIELGLVKVRVSPSAGQVTDIVSVLSQYEDPGVPIPELITEITGITDDMVAGHRFDEVELAQAVAGDAILVAHNSRFDRGFFDRRFPQHAGRRWACSIQGVNWRALGFESSKLEFLLLKNGYFYSGHRAETDCLAVAWLMHRQPGALKQLIASEARLEYVVEAVGAPFDVKDSLKTRGYRWNPEKHGKVWRTVIDESQLMEEKAFLAALYHRGDSRSEIIPMKSRTRFI